MRVRAEGPRRCTHVTIGLLCALPQEYEHLLTAMAGVATHTVADIEFSVGELDGHRVVLSRAGMGKVSAALVATVLADRFGCRAIVFSGVAGGLDPMLRIAERTIQHDAGVIEEAALQVYQAGHVPFINPTTQFGYAADPALLARVRGRLDGLTLPALSSRAGGRGRPPCITFGTVLTGDQYLHCEVTRVRLHAELAGQAVEMEGAAVSQVCESFGIPWLVVRSLSDLAGADSSVDFTAFVDEVAAQSALILRHLMPVL